MVTQVKLKDINQSGATDQQVPIWNQSLGERVPGDMSGTVHVDLIFDNGGASLLAIATTATQVDGVTLLNNYLVYVKNSSAGGEIGNIYLATVDGFGNVTWTLSSTPPVGSLFYANYGTVYGNTIIIGGSTTIIVSPGSVVPSALNATNSPVDGDVAVKATGLDKFTRQAGGGGGGSGVWSRTTRTDSVIYQAGPNGGILVAIQNTGSYSYGVTVYSDASPTPTTVVGSDQKLSNSTAYSMVTVPILPNMYYQAVSTTEIWFYEIGASGVFQKIGTTGAMSGTSLDFVDADSTATSVVSWTSSSIPNGFIQVDVGTPGHIIFTSTVAETCSFTYLLSK